MLSGDEIIALCPIGDDLLKGTHHCKDAKVQVSGEAAVGK